MERERRQSQPELISLWGMMSIAATLFLYWPMLLIVPIESINDLLDGALIGAAAVVVWKFSSWTLFNIWRPIDERFLIRAGVVLVWTGTIMWRIERFWLQFTGGQIGAHDVWRGFFILISLLAAFLHVAGIAEKDHRMAAIGTALLAGISGAIGVMLITR